MTGWSEVWYPLGKVLLWYPALKLGWGHDAGTHWAAHPGVKQAGFSLAVSF